MNSEQTDHGPALGRDLGRHALRLSGRIVAGVGRLLLWVINGVGRLLSPVTDRITARLYGPPAPPPAPGVPPRGPGGTAVYGAPPGPAGAGPLPRIIGAWHEFAASWLFAPLTGAAMTLAALAELVPHRESPVSVPGAFAVAVTLPLVWRSEFLRPVAAVVLAAYTAALLSGQPLLVTTTVAALYTLHALARQLPRQSAGLLAVAGVVTVAMVYLAADGMGRLPWYAAVLMVLAAIGLGDARRAVETAERTNAEVRERNSETLTRLTAVQREQAVMRERARIARELHDVVAHSVSMIAVQAETAPYTMDDLSPEAAQGYAEIARTAREALVEMRRLLGVLRADARGEPESAPQPRLERLPELIDQHRSAGGHVDMSVRGEVRNLSTTVELSAYRIVQEALTNARRHAPGANVRVELAYLPDRLAVRVRDDGASAPTMVLDPGRPADGHGLVGMEERATMLGGRFAAGPAETGGFVVEAELPFAREENPRP